MKKSIVTALFLLLAGMGEIFAQQPADTAVYLITCGPGSEMYSVYGHSALRIVYKQQKRDWVYNWGVFDFDTPHFGWKFAKGNLEYMLAVERMPDFLQVYNYEKRYVISQKLNLSAAETARLITLINENLRPENIKYRYDFTFDNCSSRIRDLIEKAVGDLLLYQPETKDNQPTFRSLVSKYQLSMPWLKFGIDMLLGAPVDKKESYRDRMFLPLDLKNELSETVIKRDGKMIPLLQNPEQILDFPAPADRPSFLTSPAFVFTLLLIAIVIVSAVLKRSRVLKWIDILVFGVFSILGILMMFLNIVSEHPQLRSNLNIIWLNPVVIVGLFLIIFKKDGFVWFRILFFIEAGFMLMQFILPQYFNNAIIPLVFVLLVRSSARAKFPWNPL
jgi:hypothetical protein